jgi:hypothetical protein
MYLGLVLRQIQQNERQVQCPQEEDCHHKSSTFRLALCGDTTQIDGLSPNDDIDH